MFAVTCGVGFFTSDIYAMVLRQAPWAEAPDFSALVTHFASIAYSDHKYFWQNVLAHITMLHGALSGRLLPFSEYTFNPSEPGVIDSNVF